VYVVVRSTHTQPFFQYVGATVYIFLFIDKRPAAAFLAGKRAQNDLLSVQRYKYVRASCVVVRSTQSLFHYIGATV